MATEQERARLRDDIGANASSLSNDDADAILAEAAEVYADVAAASAQARVIAIRRLLASSAKLTSYRQNASSENLGDIFRHLRELLTLWEGWRDEAVAAAGSGAARFGGMRPAAKVREYPYGS